MSEPALNLITAVQCREARALIGWSRDRLASYAELSVETIRKFEAETVLPQEHSIAQIRSALEGAGVIFASEYGEGPRVWLRKDHPVSDAKLPMITPAQCRKARHLLRLSRERLAAIAGISSVTVARFEDAKRPPRPMSVSTIRSALEAAGIIFAEENGEGPGVRLRKDTTDE